MDVARSLVLGMVEVVAGGSPLMTTLAFETALTPDGWRDGVALTLGVDGRISAVADAAPGQPLIRGAAVPGIANLHCHAFQRGMAGLTEHAGHSDDSFWTWRDLMYRFLGALTPDDVEATAAMAYVEMLEGGFTSVGEFHYLHHDIDGTPYANMAEMAERHVAAASDTGIGLCLLPVFYAHGNFGAAPPVPGQRRFLSDRDGFARLVDASRSAAARLPGARFGIAPHSLRAVAIDELTDLLAAHPAGPVHMHISEQTKEVDDCKSVHGVRPVELLFDTVSVDERWCLIHCTHADAGERALIARSGAVAGFCPVTEANLGDGLFEAVGYMSAGGRLGVGTDSNIQIGVPAELRQLEYAQRLLHRRRNALAPRGASTARTLWDAAVAGGAQALDFGAAGLRPGARADIVVLDTGHLALEGRSGDRLLDGLVFAGGDGSVRDVWSGGQQVVASGRHIHRERVERRFRAMLKALLART